MIYCNHKWLQCSMLLLRAKYLLCPYGGYSKIWSHFSIFITFDYLKHKMMIPHCMHAMSNHCMIHRCSYHQINKLSVKLFIALRFQVLEILRANYLLLINNCSWIHLFNRTHRYTWSGITDYHFDRSLAHEPPGEVSNFSSLEPCTVNSYNFVLSGLFFQIFLGKYHHNKLQ